MSDYLTRLIARSFQASDALRPRIGSLFEPRPPGEPMWGVDRAHSLHLGSHQPPDDVAAADRVNDAAVARVSTRSSAVPAGPGDRESRPSPAGDRQGPPELTPRTLRASATGVLDMGPARAPIPSGAALDDGHEVPGQPELRRRPVEDRASHPGRSHDLLSASQHPRSRDGTDTTAPTDSLPRLEASPAEEPAAGGAIPSRDPEVVVAAPASDLSGTRVGLGGSRAPRAELGEPAGQHLAPGSRRDARGLPAAIGGRWSSTRVAPVVHPRRGPRGAESLTDDQPTVHVTIGRLEVRATSQPASPPPRRAASPAIRSLDEYLRQRAERSGR